MLYIKLRRHRFDISAWGLCQIGQIADGRTELFTVLRSAIMNYVALFTLYAPCGLGSTCYFEFNVRLTEMILCLPKYKRSGRPFGSWRTRSLREGDRHEIPGCGGEASLEGRLVPNGFIIPVADVVRCFLHSKFPLLCQLPKGLYGS